MARRKVKTLDVILSEMKDYGASVNDMAVAIIDKRAGELKTAIRRDSPIAKEYERPLKRQGKQHYASGWTMKKEASKSGKHACRVYNKNEPKLVHLLEFGHKTSSGTMTRKREHVVKNRDTKKEEVLNDMEKMMERVEKS